ncbi:hypothetical protein D3C81_1196190 [compost metagenome]
MIERQHGDVADHVALIDLIQHPGATLQRIGQDVAVGQHGPLGHPRRAPRILQEGDVLGPGLDRLQRQPPRPPHHRLPAMCARQAIAGHQLLHMAHHGADGDALQARHHVTHGGDDDVADLRPLARLLQRLSEHVHHHDGDRPAVLQLMLQFARRVERVDVDHHGAGEQHPEQGRRILQAVGHHQRHPVAGLDPDRLQPGPEGLGRAQHMAIGQGRAQADIAGPLGEAARVRLEHLLHRGPARQLILDAGRHTGAIMGGPEPLGPQPVRLGGGGALDGKISHFSTTATTP